MIQKLRRHINQNFPFIEGKKILIAISGGVDSVVLAHLFHKLNYDISLAHCNFQLRGKESDLDEQFVERLGKKLELKVFTTKFETNVYAAKHKLSTQIAARDLRYKWFQKLAKEYLFEYVLTAHHANDNLETFLINLSRGTGLEGLTGIPSVNKNIIRPLLPFSSKELLNFAVDQKISWREDASNAAIKYTRNKIRHQIIPVLETINPQLIETFNRTTDYLQSSQRVIKESIDEMSKKILTKENDLLKINISELRKINSPKVYLFELLKSYGFTEWNDVYNLVSAQSGKYILTKSHRLLKDREFLLLLPISESSLIVNKKIKIEESSTKITNPIRLCFENVQQMSLINNNIVYLDKKLLNYPLILRKWKEGDFFYPTGMSGKKKLSKFFKDEKLSLIDKERTWLLCSSKDEIIWIIGKRSDRRFTVSKETNRILKISILTTPINYIE
ncbi:tRNA lysidine(34) synthetase TilS [Tenacibaculum maritimum]|uniref:tRNA lysidine(34) synthetase TilS n=1 Tax=Tenacibaculum maritimum TaxID=107401 RepID=UPI001E3DE81C|nr:tRNA lysidine(34) synthetase TilS [Tenacibaculum maritimum]MCD9585014.1 tRNA lysidine(34) synthetase TilS [Tenacibaculum maritimum]MCD9620796.1 tRNA lysidine(34) synthetase TilS [Tenacibaculum maritimum]MCD9626919.1 tRNA lysidine(34) synthetase TilS [Tenacibaculum maritimum]MCD9629582.1 tRNA lysidine(34) synthetase TilS [Tenacibaculum maritimum]MCD9632593.1 tRNA lysidine(34) synthetase TilS [Tenacibaculum maritimum]